MAKEMQKAFSCILSLSLCVSLLSVGAWAEEGSTITTTGSGTAQDPEITITITREDPVQDEETGERRQTTRTEKTWEGTTPKGAEPGQEGTVTTVTGESQSRETKITNDGEWIRTEGCEQGEQTTATTETETKTEEKTLSQTETEQGDWSDPVKENKVDLTEGSRAPQPVGDSEAISLQYGVDYGEVSVAVTPGSTNTAEGEAVDWSRLLSETTFVDRQETDPDTGAVTTTRYELQKDCNDNIVGYTKTVTVTGPKAVDRTETHDVSSGQPETMTEGELPEAEEKTETRITLPEGYTAGIREEISGDRRTTTTVEELYDEEDGVTVIGYRTTKTVCSADGTKQISTQSECVFGTRTTITTKLTPQSGITTVAADRVTSQTVTAYTRGVTVAGEKIEVQNGARVVWAEMCDVKTGEGNGRIVPVLITPDGTLLSDGTGTPDSELNVRHLCNDWPSTADSADPREGWLQYVGYGVSSTGMVRVDLGGGSGANYSTHQFKLVGKDERGGDVAYYVYCADLSTTARPGYNYQMKNLEDADYYVYPGADPNVKEHIRAIAENGYWGTVTAKGAADPEKGSIEAMRALLKKARYDENAPDSVKALRGKDDSFFNMLDDGLALTATQAALWKFGHNDEGHFIGGGSGKGGDSSAFYEPFEDPIRVYKTGGTQNLLNSSEWTVANALYDLLVSDYLMNKTIDTATDIMQTSDIKGAAITVKNKVTDAQGAVQKTADGEDIYKTDVSFALQVDHNQLNGDLIVRVIDAADPTRVLATGRIAGQAQAGEVDFTACNGDYTFRDLEMANGMKITLNLSGTQYLDEGVYLFSSELRGETSSQTFVGLSTAGSTQAVNLEVDLAFRVTEPEAVRTVMGTEYTESVTETETRQRTDTITAKEITAELSIITVTEDESRLKWEKTWETKAPVIPLGDEDPSEEIPEENVPRTDDISAVWKAQSLLAGFGLLGMALAERKRRGKAQ